MTKKQRFVLAFVLSLGLLLLGVHPVITFVLTMLLSPTLEKYIANFED